MVSLGFLDGDNAGDSPLLAPGEESFLVTGNGWMMGGTQSDSPSSEKALESRKQNAT